jgi:hypothetical protein
VPAFSILLPEVPVAGAAGSGRARMVGASVRASSAPVGDVRSWNRASRALTWPTSGRNRTSARCRSPSAASVAGAVLSYASTPVRDESPAVCSPVRPSRSSTGPSAGCCTLLVAGSTRASRRIRRPSPFRVRSSASRPSLVWYATAGNPSISAGRSARASARTGAIRS